MDQKILKSVLEDYEVGEVMEDDNADSEADPFEGVSDESLTDDVSSDED